MPRPGTFKFWDLVHVILETLRYFLDSVCPQGYLGSQTLLQYVHYSWLFTGSKQICLTAFLLSSKLYHNDLCTSWRNRTCIVILYWGCTALCITPTSCKAPLPWKGTKSSSPYLPSHNILFFCPSPGRDWVPVSIVRDTVSPMLWFTDCCGTFYTNIHLRGVLGHKCWWRVHDLDSSWVQHERQGWFQVCT